MTTRIKLTNDQTERVIHWLHPMNEPVDACLNYDVQQWCEDHDVEKPRVYEYPPADRDWIDYFELRFTSEAHATAFKVRWL